MKTYDELRAICKRNSRISERVVDDFLISYAAGHQGLEKKMEREFDRFRHVGKQMGKENINMLKTQYLAHKVFRQEGLLGKFLKHPALDRFKGEERDYLAQALKLPWRFCFSVIVDEPASDFYVMEDVFSGKKYLLFSPGVSDIRDKASPVLWFNLIGFNGFCWQSYGPVVYYLSFEAADIWFYATELNPDLEDFREVAADVELDPLPYMMLISGASMPHTYHEEDQLLYLLSEFDLDSLDTASLKKSFKTEYEQGVYRITHKQSGEHPHFAQAYFDEKKHLLLITAMTRRGFEVLIKAFNAFGHDYPVEPYLSVNMTMVSTAAMILKKKVVLNEYLDLFKLEADPGKEKVLGDINAFIALVLPDINAGITPDIEEAARKAGVDIETAHSVMEAVLGSKERLPNLAKGRPSSGRPASGRPASGKPAPGKPAPGRPAPGKKASPKKRKALTRTLPVQAREGIRLLSSDDKLLFNLHLYMMAGKIRRDAPWEYLYEDEVFGVQVPGTDRVYFVSVMGSDGEFPALAFYKGYEGLADFLEFRDQVEIMTQDAYSSESMQRASTMIGGIMTIPHLMLSFTNRERLDKDNLSAIKKSGASFRGKGNWPEIGEIVPGYVPVYPGRESLVELFLVMQQVLAVFEKMEEDDGSLLRIDGPEDTYLVRVPSGKGPKFRWKDHYLLIDPEWGETSYSVITSKADSVALSRLPVASQELQLDLFMLPNPVREKGSPDYFPFVLLLLDKLNDKIISSSILPPHPDLTSLYESVPQKVLEELIKTGHRPAKIEIRSNLLLSLLEETLEGADCRVVWEDQMPEMDDAIASLISHLT